MSKEKKRHHVGRNIAITLLVIFIGIPILAVGITYAVFYDGYNATLNVEKKKDITDIFNDLLVDSVEESSTSKNVDFQMNQDTLDTLLYSATSQMDATTKSYIPQLYVEINSDNYDFIAEVSVPMFKTRVHLVTQLSYVEGSSYLENYFLFKIKEIKLGRSPNMDALVKSIASNFIKEADIQSLFDNAGLSLKVDLANNQITYTQGDFIDDIASLLGSGSNSD